jgi:hypothetical protein
VVSKDLSHISLERATITGASEAGLAAFVKLAVYGPASIEASEVTIQNAPHYAIVQTGSVVTVDGLPLETQDIDAASLY